MNPQHDVLLLAQKLMEKPSISPDDAGCQILLTHWLKELGFTVQSFDSGRVKNIWARYGTVAPLFIFAGHTDVVPTGDLSAWLSPPFQPEIRDGYLFGRGACDMKGGLAAMIAATASFLKNNRESFHGSLGFLITSGEEGDDYNDGTPHVMQQLAALGEIPDYCIVGEPSCTAVLGDMIKIGRRGSLSGLLTLHGKQGHVAYPQQLVNPIHQVADFLQECVHTVWDEGNAHFPPTSFQITRIHADGQSGNVVPGELQLAFNFRYSPMSSQETLQARIEALLEKHTLNDDLQWRLSGLPFLTQEGALLNAAQQAIQSVCHITPQLSTSGGTSDGRFIAPYGVDVIELGLINKTIHQINESTSVEALQQLVLVYGRILLNLFDSTVI